MSMRWEFPITSHYGWLSEFSRNNIGVDYAICGEYDHSDVEYFCFSSRHLEGLSDPVKVIKRATALKALVDGALYVRHPGFSGLDFGPLIDNQGISHGTYVVEIKEDAWGSPFDLGYTAFTPSLPSGTTPRWTEAAIFISKYDSATKDILEFIGVNGLTWISLYACIETIKEAGWSESKIESAAGSSGFRLFKHTSNTYKATGPFGRHGHTPCAPPPVPMKIADAKIWVMKVVEKFIESRFTTCDISAKWTAFCPNIR